LDARWPISGKFDICTRPLKLKWGRYAILRARDVALVMRDFLSRFIDA
jgi:hypothetical protein